MEKLKLPHGEVNLPAFFPDGTRGVVKGVDSIDLENAQVQGLVMNTFHLLTNPGSHTIKAMSGLNSFIGWNRPIITDSGGFQVFSLIRENSKFGEIRRNEIIFRSESRKEKIKLSPERCVQLQFSCGSDIIMCLDYCTHPDDSYEINKLSVDTTVRWAKQCKSEYLRIINNSKKQTEKPLIFGIIQGGGYKELRDQCAVELIQLGFDGFGFGGWPLNAEGKLIEDILRYTAGLMPDNSIKYAMGIGKPEEIVICHKMGYNLFDCVIPTREARHNRLYIFNEDAESPDEIELDRPDFYSHYYITDEVYRRDNRPVSGICDCLCCKNYSRAYLRHLYIIGDTLAYRLATIHNLRFYTQLMQRLQGEKWK